MADDGGGRAELENQLRNMILSNVTIGGEPRQQTPRGHNNTNNHRNSRNNQQNSWRQTNQAQHKQAPKSNTRNDHPLPQLAESRQKNSFESPVNAQPNTRYQRKSHNANASSHQAAPSRFTPLMRRAPPNPEEIFIQCDFLEQIARQQLPLVEMSQEEFSLKESFRVQLERKCHEIVGSYFAPETTVLNLPSYGSLSSGFAMPGSDMDLALISSIYSPHIPRLLEKSLLDAGYGVRLLTRTRVPIMKFCEKPTPELYTALVEERKKWDSMTPEEREDYDNPKPQEEDGAGADAAGNLAPNSELENYVVKLKSTADPSLITSDLSTSNEVAQTASYDQAIGKESADSFSSSKTTDIKERKKAPKHWYRERRLGPLDFPKHGLGIQCDINLAGNPLGLHNTLLLRCYSQCDIRVRLMVLFVKAWASRRKINSGYHGTLSSYGYVLMVLHFLMNVVQPPVIPNLQHINRNWDVPPLMCDGYDVTFWRNEPEIQRLGAKRMLTHNNDPLGVLLRNFFQYYAQQGHAVIGGGFLWTMRVLSLRTLGGILSKEEKGWTGAKTTVHDHKEVRQRYLFAIEDPFELDHNVARTVTHNGIVAIRDEFRRAWRITCAAGAGRQPEGHLFEEVISVAPPKEAQQDDAIINPKVQAPEEQDERKRHNLVGGAKDSSVYPAADIHDALTSRT